jgi:hypothetical protein
MVNPREINSGLVVVASGRTIALACEASALTELQEGKPEVGDVLIDGRARIGILNTPLLGEPT